MFTLLLFVVPFLVLEVGKTIPHQAMKYVGTIKRTRAHSWVATHLIFKVIAFSLSSPSQMQLLEAQSHKVFLELQESR